MNPNAAQPAGGPPTSFKTNVNRAKTKRWVEAKTVSYDGDDWGEADEYDEYGGYSAGAVQKPTGLRQQGQSALQPAGVLDRPDAQASPVAYGERTYIAPGGKISQLHQGFDEQIAPGPQAYQQPKDGRTYSLNKGEEKRAFSGGNAQYGTTGNLYPGQFQQTQGMHQTAPQVRAPAPAQYQQAVQGGSKSSLDGQSRLASVGPPPSNYRGVAYSDRPRPPHEGSRTQSMSSSTSSQDFQARRDFSPSAVPQPLHPQNRDLPPRKSSLSQEDTPRIPGGPFSPATNIQSNPTEPSEAAMMSRPTESENRNDVASKPLPFVRPVDIYKRLAAERERERQSQESSRPSMEAILDPKPLSTHEDSATNIRGHSNTDDSRFTPRGRPSFEREDDSESGRHIKTSLDPVVERRSEYGMEGPSLSTAVPTDQVPLPNSARSPEVSKTTEMTANRDGSPRLPEVPRMSGFGESFLGSMQGSFNATPDVDTPEIGHLQFLSKLSEEPHDASLQHQASVGFRSVVNKAFEDQVPQTPSSAAGSAVARSNSESTNAISPIISRAPSAVNSGAKHKDVETGENSIAMITEEPTTRAYIGRPGSGDTIVTPKATTRKPSPSQTPWQGPAESLPANTGHRRNISTPSPGDSPARTPAVEITRHLRQPQEAELAVTTPTSMTHSSSSVSNAMSSEASNRSEESADASAEPSAPIERPSHESYAVMPLASDMVGNSVAGPRSAVDLTFPVTPTKTFSRGHPESPTKSRSRVRDLADRFESEDNIRRDSGSSLRESAPMERPNENLYSRPQNDRMESFRPHLPGGWESYASTAPGSGPASIAEIRGQTLGPQVSTQASYDGVSPSAIEIQAMNSSRSDKSDVNRVGPTTNTGNQFSLRDHAPTLTSHSSPPASEGFSLSDPFSAVAAAGTALAGAVTAAVGFDRKDSESDEEIHPRDETPAMKSSSINQGPSASTGNTAYHPEASRPWVPPEDDSASSVSPTPLAIDTDNHQHQSNNPNYFPPVVPLKQRPRDIQTTNEVTPLRPQILPALSTETSPNDYESDRLRKELVRELSPHAESFPHDQTAGLDAPLVEESRLPDTSVLGSQDHDSMFLPMEYDSYWNGSNSGDNASHRISHQDAPESLEVRSELNEKIAIEGGALLYAETPHETIPTDLVSTQQAPDSNRLQVRPSQLTHRFSWEPEPEKINAERQELPDVNSGNQSPPTTAPAIDYAPLPADSPTAHNSFAIPQLHKQLPEEPAELAQELRHSTESHRQQQQNHEARMPNDTQMIANAEAMSIPPLPTEQPKIPAFREILALKNPTERVQAYKTTRDQFASMNTGLDDWLVATLNDLPEHAELRDNGGTFGNVSSHRPPPPKGKFPGLRATSGQTQAQPYYQQYLNASSQPGISSPAVSASANVAGSPSYSPASASSKAPVQQMQAKGKDLLHSAGIFGGKANFAAKGLFSKGKSKLRGSGGADKATPQTCSDPNPDYFQAMRPHNERPAFQTQSISQTYQVRPVIFSSNNDSSPSQSHSGQIVFQSNESLPKSESGNQARKSHDTEQFATGALGGADKRSIQSDSSVPKDDDTYGVAVRQYIVPKADSRLKNQNEIDQAQQRPAVSPLSVTSDAVHSPRSQSSSNHTPTQADFFPSSLNHNPSSPLSPRPPGIPSMPPKAYDIASSQPPVDLLVTDRTKPIQAQSGTAFAPPQMDDSTTRAREKSSIATHDGTELRPGQGLRVSTSKQLGVNSAPRISEDSEGTFHTADSGEEFEMRQNPAKNLIEPLASSQHNSQGFPGNVVSQESGTMSQRNESNRGSQRFSSTYSSTTGEKGNESSRPFSFISFGQMRTEDLALRGPGFDSSSGEVYKELPLTPVSPQQPVLSQQNQVTPIHHDINHDFSPESGSSFDRPRSRSFSRPFQDPNIHQHPAFRQEEEAADTNSLPSSHYPAQLRRDEAMIPQATEYQLDGVGPPTTIATDNKTRSRRNSRGSAFFKSIGSSLRPDPPPVPTNIERQTAELSSTPPLDEKKKRKRASLFRSLTGHSGSDIARSPESPIAQPSRARTDLPQYTQTSAIPLPHGQYRSPTDPRTSKVSDRSSKKLQRASMSGVQEQDKGKKKRFSGLGTLFGRSSPKQQAATAPVPQSAFPISQPQLHPQLQPQQQGPFDQWLATPEFRQTDITRPTDQSSPYNGGHDDFYGPALPSGYERPSLEGYYSPDRVEGSFSPDLAGGQPAIPDIYQNPSRELPVTHTNSRSPKNITAGSTPKSYRASPNQTDSPIQIIPGNDSAMRNLRGRLNTPPGKSDSPPPPPPPPKDDYLQHGARSNPASYMRSSSQNLRTTQYTPSKTSHGHLRNRQSLPPLETRIPQARASSSKPITPEEIRKARQRQIEGSGQSSPSPFRPSIQPEQNGREEKIIMSSTSYPGQEWQPNYGNWDGE